MSTTFEGGYPPPAFSFAVSIGNSQSIDDAAFSEVSGIGTEVETEAVQEGGENRFVHQLPKSVKHGQLELKRGIARVESRFAAWCKKTLENEFATPIELQIVIVSLVDANGAALRAWQFNDAWPVKWSIDAFSSTKNEVAVEKISLAYSYAQRTQ